MFGAIAAVLTLGVEVIKAGYHYAKEQSHTYEESGAQIIQDLKDLFKTHFKITEDERVPGWLKFSDPKAIDKQPLRKIPNPTERNLEAKDFDHTLLAGKTKNILDFSASSCFGVI